MVSSVSAIAQPGPSQEVKRKGKAHYQQGKAFHAAGSYDRAIVEYQAAYQLTPVPELLFNIAQAYRLKGDRTSALGYYRSFIEVKPEGPTSDVARQQVAELIREIDQAKPAEQKAKPTRLAAPTPTPAPSPSQDIARPGRAMRIAGIAVGLVGLGLLGTGIYYAIDASSKASDVEALFHAPAGMEMTWNGALDEAGQSSRTKALILLSVGGAATIGGGLLYYFGWRAGKSTPDVAWTRGGLTLGWRGSF